MFLVAQTPSPGGGALVLPQDRIIPFLGGGSLLRSSTLGKDSGVVVALGGAPVELVIATDVSLQFLQITTDPKFLFRVREKIALRIEPAGAILQALCATGAAPGAIRRSRPRATRRGRPRATHRGRPRATRRRRPRGNPPGPPPGRSAGAAPGATRRSRSRAAAGAAPGATRRSRPPGNPPEPPGDTPVTCRCPPGLPQVRTVRS